MQGLEFRAFGFGSLGLEGYGFGFKVQGAWCVVWRWQQRSSSVRPLATPNPSAATTPKLQTQQTLGPKTLKLSPESVEGNALTPSLSGLSGKGLK